jgi:hypothetical protein
MEGSSPDAAYRARYKHRDVPGVYFTDHVTWKMEFPGNGCSGAFSSLSHFSSSSDAKKAIIGLEWSTHNVRK